MKDQQLHIRLTKDQLEKIKSQAKEAGCSTSDYVLQSLGIQKRTYNEKLIFNTLTSFAKDDKKVENNINQIAKHLNQNPKILSNEIINEFINHIDKYIKKRENLRKVISKLITVIAEK